MLINPRYKITKADNPLAQHRVGRIVEFKHRNVGKQCVWHNVNEDNYTYTSPVVEIIEEDNSLTIKTCYTYYTFEKEEE